MEITLKEAAFIIGCSRSHVQRQIDSGTLKGGTIRSPVSKYRRWYVDRDDAIQFARKQNNGESG